MGYDPTIGGPARVATRAGPFLAERVHNTDFRSYKDGLSARETHRDGGTGPRVCFRREVMGFARSTHPCMLADGDQT